MACCAFAAFILSQAIFWLNSVRERLGLGPLQADGPSQSAMWTINAPPQRPRAPKPPYLRWALTTAAAVAAGAGIGAIWFSGGPSELMDMTGHWCRTLPVQIAYASGG